MRTASTCLSSRPRPRTAYTARRTEVGTLESARQDPRHRLGVAAAALGNLALLPNLRGEGALSVRRESGANDVDASCQEGQRHASPALRGPEQPHPGGLLDRGPGNRAAERLPGQAR